MKIEVAYATPERQLIIALEVEAGISVGQAIERSGMRSRFPEIDPAAVVGIFGRVVTLQTVLGEGDRVEIYRALAGDPKEIRRRRAKARGSRAPAAR